MHRLYYRIIDQARGIYTAKYRTEGFSTDRASTVIFDCTNLTSKVNKLFIIWLIN